MSLPQTLNDREFQKFELTFRDEAAVRIKSDTETLNVGGVISSVTLNAATWTALPATPYAYRKTISIQNQSSGSIKLNYNASAIGYTGVIIPKDGERVYNLSPEVVIYGKCQSGTSTIIVEEVG